MTLKPLFHLLPTLVLAAGLLASCGTRKLSYDELRLRYLDKLTSAQADTTDSIVRARVAGGDPGMRQMWNEMNKDSARTYLWYDRDCIDDTISPWRPTSVTTPLGRLAAMAVTYQTPTSPLYKNDTLLRDAIDGMEWMYANKWSPEHPMYGNWYDWIIGMPFAVNNFITALYDELTPEQRAKYIAALDYYAPGITYEGASTGANKIWQCYSMALRGILARDPAKIKMGQKGIDTEFKIVDYGDGFYEDGSFVQHEWHAYTGGYGAGMLSVLVQMISMLHGSEWAVSNDHTQMVGTWLENAYLPLIYNGAIMDMVRGREIARGSTDRSTGHSILLSAYNVSKMMDKATAERLQGRIKYEWTVDTLRNFILNDAPLWQLGELRAFMNNDAVKPVAPAPYFKPFAMMDRFVQVRPNFGVGLALSSNRIEGYESIDTENMKAWHCGDGMTYIYNGDMAQYTDNYWSTVDYYRLPGTTVDKTQHPVKSMAFGKGVLYADGYKSPYAWVGGSALEGICGMVGMWFKDGNSSLTSKKSWFLAGDQMVALGAGISSTGNVAVETIVDNRKVSPGVGMTLTVDEKAVLEKNGAIDITPSWVQVSTPVSGSDMGYYFPEPQQLTMLKETRTGTWREFTKYGSTIPYTRNYMTLIANHGKNPKDATYSYVVLPGASVAQMKAYAADPDAMIVANTPEVQAVKSRSAEVTGINFWSAPTAPVAGVSVSAPSSVIFQRKDGLLQLGVSDPTQKLTEPFTISFDCAVQGEAVSCDPRIKVLSSAPLKLEVNPLKGLGATFAAAFKLAD
jgi:hyaluronate lyase